MQACLCFAIAICVSILVLFVGKLKSRLLRSCFKEITFAIRCNLLHMLYKATNGKVLTLMDSIGWFFHSGYL